MVPVFLGATLLIYGMVFLLPGDPVAAMAGDRPLTPAVAAQLRAQYHLDDPFLLQYLRYLGGLLHGDLGRAYSGLPVSAVLAHAFPVTIRLALIALAVEAVLGIGFGVIAGLRQGGIFDATVLITGLVIIAIPIFVLGFLAQFVFGVRLGIAPVTVGDRATFARLLLPGIVLGSVSFAYVVRLTRSAVAANAHADYVRTATAKGLVAAAGGDGAHPAQLADPGGDLPGCRPRGADGRSHRDRRDLQHPRRRRRAVSGGHPAGGADGGVDRDGAGADLSDHQPVGGPALRRARPADPLWLSIHGFWRDTWRSLRRRRSSSSPPR